MAIKKLSYNSKVYLPVYECQDVALCLDDSFAAKTVSGKPILLAKIDMAGRYLGPMIGAPKILWENPRGLDLYQYDISFDDAQLLNDPLSGQPFIVLCSDIDSVFDACVAKLILPL